MSLQNVIDASNSFEAIDGYDKTKNPRRVRVRYLTPGEARFLEAGHHALFVSPDGKLRRLKVNGVPKTWKRTPERVEVPCKYGLYECATFEARDGRVVTGNGAALVVEVEDVKPATLPGVAELCGNL